MGAWPRSRYGSLMVVVLPAAELSPSKNYFLLTSLLVPRPIAWVTTRSTAGVVNLAPFSFYGGICGNPPIVGLGIARRADGHAKDTARNAIETGELVIHLAEAAQLDAMVESAIELEPECSEVELLGLPLVESQVIAVPSLECARVRLECRLHSHQEVGHGPVDFLMAEIVAFVLPEDLLDERGRVRETELRPLARHGAAFYSEVQGLFERRRPSQG